MDSLPLSPPYHHCDIVSVVPSNGFIVTLISSKFDDFWSTCFHSVQTPIIIPIVVFLPWTWFNSCYYFLAPYPHASFSQLSGTLLRALRLCGKATHTTSHLSLFFTRSFICTVMAAFTRNISSLIPCDPRRALANSGDWNLWTCTLFPLISPCKLPYWAHLILWTFFPNVAHTMNFFNLFFLHELSA